MDGAIVVEDNKKFERSYIASPESDAVLAMGVV